jgi:hypothetical protein
MNKQKQAKIIGVCTIAIMLIVAITICPACQPQTRTPPAYGLVFDGTDDYVSLGNATTLGFTSQNFTIEAWIKPDTVARRMEIFTRHKYNNDGYRLDAITNGTLEFYTFQSGANQVSKTSSAVLTIDNWSHIAVVRQGTSVRIYVNGVNVTGTAGSHIDPAYSASRNASIGTSYTPEVFDGTISEVRVWNYARSESQINAGMYGNFTGSESGLVGYWRLNEGSGTIAHDSTANNNHGTLYGNPIWFTGGG